MTYVSTIRVMHEANNADEANAQLQRMEHELKMFMCVQRAVAVAGVCVEKPDGEAQER